MAAEEVVALYATKLFIRSEAEARRPVVLLSGERTNVYGVLEKHFKETSLPPSERFWRAVRTQWTPQLDTWRPRVNGVQLKVLAGARLPESEEEWAALRSALSGLRQHLRPDSSVEALHGELQDFVQMVVGWWENRKKTETGGAGGSMLLKRVASAGLLLGPHNSINGLPPINGLHPAKKPCIEFMQLGPPQHPSLPTTTVYNQRMYAAPEILPMPLLNGPPGAVPAVPAAEEVAAANGAAGQQGGSQHGGGGYMQHLAGAIAVAPPTDSQLFDQLFPAPDGGAGLGQGAGGRGESGQSPRGRQAVDGAVGEGGGLGSGFAPQLSPRVQQQQLPREGSADNQLPRPPPAADRPAVDGKRFVTLSVGGHRFLTTAATLAAVDGSYFCKLAQQASSSSASKGGSEFFVDRSGKTFEYVLDYLRSQRFGDSPSNLPKDERTLQLLAREADFFQLPGLAERARAASAAATAATAAAGRMGLAGEDTPSDVHVNTAAEGSAHGGLGALLLMNGRMGSAGLGASGSPLLASGHSVPQPPMAAAAGLLQPAVLDAFFLETGFQPASELAGEQAGLLAKLNAALAAKQADGFAVLDVQSGAEREGPLRNLFYHVLLRKAGAAS